MIFAIASRSTTKKSAQLDFCSSTIGGVFIILKLKFLNFEAFWPDRRLKNRWRLPEFAKATRDPAALATSKIPQCCALTFDSLHQSKLEKCAPDQGPQLEKCTPDQGRNLKNAPQTRDFFQFRSLRDSFLHLQKFLSSVFRAFPLVSIQATKATSSFVRRRTAHG